MLTLYRRVIILFFHHDPLSTTSYEETFLLDFLEILKRLFKNFSIKLNVLMC